MKKLIKPARLLSENTVEAYACPGGCTCPCGTCSSSASQASAISNAYNYNNRGVGGNL